ncbi:MAG: YqgE/AlgH family protein [Acidimicrobiaceae bacterium]|nr:YqgE/AlgH family protein [Acidimicrobiaceae bacterium]MBO0747552.1 YqgE/AlgH family protein [Acidimicrobiaceae bacterium]
MSLGPDPLVPRSPLRGRLLVANPLLPDPNFDRCVILILAHGSEGALGVVLNRPSSTSVIEVLPHWATTVSPPSVVFAGGPVNARAVIGVARRQSGAAPSWWQDGPAWTTVSDDLGTVDLDLDPSAAEEDLAAVRVFAGYSGWDSGQLEGEIAAGAWWVVDAAPSDAFGPRPADLWHDVLRRQEGSLALVAAFPPDPEMN